MPMSPFRSQLTNHIREPSGANVALLYGNFIDAKSLRTLWSPIRYAQMLASPLE